jgi:hypothetical protein
MEQNKTSKYFKYAVGEILLVVIGILIALQINNWNENRKNRIFEQEILFQLQENLKKDQASLKLIRHNFTRAIQSSNKIVDAINTKTTEQDSIPLWLGDVVQFDRFQPLTNGYEVLKSRGLDKISNRELRFLLGGYYDDESKHVVKSIGDLETTFLNYWVPILNKNATDFKFKHHFEVQDYEGFFNENRIKNMLINNRDNFGGGVNRINSVLTTIDTILVIISNNLVN